jgi:hypothetical protein
MLIPTQNVSNPKYITEKVEQKAQIFKAQIQQQSASSDMKLCCWI